ncbi:MAG TPA: hypothetical protein VF656_12985 [Pyrinomonadaceae bacterium]
MAGENSERHDRPPRLPPRNAAFASRRTTRRRTPRPSKLRRLVATCARVTADEE